MRMRLAGMRVLRWLGALALLVVVATLGVYAYLQHPKFGTLPQGASLDLVRQSPHQTEGVFRNLIDTPMRTADSSLSARIALKIKNRNARLTPDTPLPSVRRDLRALDRAQDVVVWLGHSSYFIQIGGRRILIDPAFSSEAAPAPYLNSAFDGTTPYTADDMPDIDTLLITHDHWDHLDHPSLVALRERVRHVVTGLGAGATLEHWGYARERIHEADWNTVLTLDEGLRIHVLPARHYSGRMFTRNRTLWVGYALETAQRRMFFSGDSGYGPHFREIGERLGGFDLVALDAGQYDQRWANIHMVPEEAAQAAVDLRAKVLLPGHAGRFKIAAHEWDEPFVRMAAASAGRPYTLLTPVIGDLVRLDDADQRFPAWWQDLPS